jgi:hypothetical protein
MMRLPTSVGLNRSRCGDSRSFLLCAMLAAIVVWPACCPPSSGAQESEIDFARDVRPILASRCFKCHGPDEQQRQSGLRLDERDAAVGEADSGARAIVPGRPDASELVRRIFSDDESEVMPPPDSKLALTDGQRETLRRWIAAGAIYQPHWAFQPVQRPALPAVRLTDWPCNEIDYFILARMEQQGLAPSPRADRYALVRRLYLDLLGVAPTPEEADLFVQDGSPDAYEKLVDRLLASPLYGERWARRWLDLARYADTNGYEKDRPRSMWPYRDWVIQAINADMPFDQFTVEQLAGDMLPEPTIRQRIATGFHRNTMINEEGGIDPLEFRFYSVVDRINTTGTVWLGMTIGCAQCHTHKYDPIEHRDYYQLLAYLNNADEPVLDVPKQDILEQRDRMLQELARREQRLADEFPIENERQWQVAHPLEATSAHGATAEVLDDHSVRFSGKNPDRDTYTFVLEQPANAVSWLRIEALADPLLPSNGPGRTPHGNYVLSELVGSVVSTEDPGTPLALNFVTAQAARSQDGFPVEHAIDGDAGTGWAVHVPGEWNVTHTADFQLKDPVKIPPGSKWTLRLEQQHGLSHTIGRVRISLGTDSAREGDPEQLRREHRDQKFAAWRQQQASRAVRWMPLSPAKAQGSLPQLDILDDGSVLARGDQSKRDIYDLQYIANLEGVTAIRLEAMSDERLPQGGPGRVYYEGPIGDFFLSEFKVRAGGQPIELVHASQSFANGGNTADKALDGDQQTGWSINGGQGKSHTAVFRPAAPLTGVELGVELLFERYYAAGLGRFRISVTTDEIPAEAGLPPDIETLMLVNDSQLSSSERERLLQYFLQTCAELESARKSIESYRNSIPALPTTLVLDERPSDLRRPTYIHTRGEFLRPSDAVRPGLPKIFHGASESIPHDRLEFAHWLVDPQNPLVSRVTINRHWGNFFGRGIVRTTEDFGFQGDLPTHPLLLDWLASELIRRDWSLKQMHRLIVTSATYQQSSEVPQELLARDADNMYLARAPRVRLEAEMLRDSQLRTAGLLTTRIGGPSVFPPQPAGITTEGTYGPLDWKVSAGEDRYRRGLYTFMKRTAPYAMFATFDAPSGEACTPRRDVTDTPLQALTLLNDEVFFEAAQALGRLAARQPGTPEEKVQWILRRCLTRPPTDEEVALVLRFWQAQQQRLAGGGLKAQEISGGDADQPQAPELAAWTLVARIALNLDETICKP